jgi:molecular chaperone GrpE
LRSDNGEPDTAVEARIDELGARLREAEDRRLRQAADFENYKRRAERDRQEVLAYAATTVAERLLPVIDDAERALAHVPEGTDEEWLRGLHLVVAKLRDVLASVGVEPIEALGARFDPRFHEAVGFVETTAQPEGTVVDDLRRGYRLRDRVLRPSVVRLARSPAEAEPRPEPGPEPGPEPAPEREPPR